MKTAFYVLLTTGGFAIAATLVAWMWDAQQEDVSCAIGGVAGFLLANGIAFTLRRSNSREEEVVTAESTEFGFFYGLFAIFFFAFVGWLSGYLHNHGDLAGTVCGGLGGYILSVSVPAIHRSSFLAASRRLQFLLAILALCGLIGIVWVMYKREVFYMMDQMNSGSYSSSVDLLNRLSLDGVENLAPGGAVIAIRARRPFLPTSRMTMHTPSTSTV